MVDPDPARAIVQAADEEAADVVVVGNVGMSGNKKFLLGNVPNRVSHNARCTVLIVNTDLVDREGHHIPVVPTADQCVCQERSISSNDRPLVSGTQRQAKTRVTRHMAA